MRVIQPSATMLIPEDPYKFIETIGRTCYKSEPKNSLDSATAFVTNLIKRGHCAMLEHYWFTVHVNLHSEVHKEDFMLPWSKNLGSFFSYSLRHIFDAEYTSKYEIARSLQQLFLRHYANPKIKSAKIANATVEIIDADELEMVLLNDGIGYNRLYKAIFDKRESLSRETLLDEFQDFWGVHKFYTFKFICDRGVSHELVRHRCSFAQESTRYCNYSKDKFNNELTFIEPAEFDSWSEEMQDEWESSMKHSENAYMNMIDAGATPQQARAVLPCSVKTEIIMTANVNQWYHFFDLRKKGTTGAPHPDMQVVADIAYKQFMKSEFEVYHRADEFLSNNL